MQTHPGLRETAHLGGLKLATWADAFKPSYSFAETHERAGNTRLLTERLLAWAGCPSLVYKITFSIAWSSVNASDMRTFLMMQCSGAATDFADWRPQTEEFVSAGTATIEMSRRIAIAEITDEAQWPVPDADTRYATEVLVETSVGSGVFAATSAYSLGTATSTGHQPLTFDSAPTAGKRIIVLYCPLYMLRRVGLEIGFLKHMESRTLVLEEIG